MIGGQEGFQVCLVHVLPPLPPGLLEFGGADYPELEHQLDTQYRKAQEQWITKAKRRAGPVFTKAKSILRKAGVPKDAIEMQFSLLSNGEEIFSTILDFAQRQRFGVVVLGREFFSGIKRFLQHHVADELIQKGKGLTIWVVQ